MLILILKFLAGMIAAIIATKIIIIKTGHEDVGPWHVGKWRFTTEALLSVSALWLTFVFSTGTDLLKYRGDAKTAEDQRKKSEELINRQNEIKNLAATANDRIERAANNLSNVAQTTTETLASVNTANGKLEASAGTLNQVVQRQIDATATASETLGRLTETSTMVRRSSKPLRPLEFTLHLKYEYEKTSDEIRGFVNNVKRYVDNIELGGQGQKDHWTATTSRIHITGPSALLALGGGRVQQILTSGTVGIKIRPTETESGSVTNDKVDMIAHAGFTSNKPVSHDPSFTVVPQPSDLQIYIDRRTGDITELFFLKRVDASGALFGINSMYDLPSKWLELSLPSPVELRDNPKVTFLAYRNDTFITGGKFPESIILMADRFKGPFQLEHTRDNPEGKGVTFRYPIQEADLNSAALFEKQRQ